MIWAVSLLTLDLSTQGLSAFDIDYLVVFGVFWISVRWLPPSKQKFSTPTIYQKHSTYIDFVENQLKPSLKAYHS
jgi:hypothetical protein